MKQLDTDEMVSGMVNDSLDAILDRARFIGKGSMKDERQFEWIMRYLVLMEDGLEELTKSLACGFAARKVSTKALSRGLGIDESVFDARYGRLVERLKTHPDDFIPYLRFVPPLSTEQRKCLDRFKKEYAAHPLKRTITTAIASQNVPIADIERVVSKTKKKTRSTPSKPKKPRSVLDEPGKAGVYLTADASPHVLRKDGNGHWSVTGLDGERLHDADDAVEFGWTSVVNLFTAEAFPLKPLA